MITIETQVGIHKITVQAEKAIDAIKLAGIFSRLPGKGPSGGPTGFYAKTIVAKQGKNIGKSYTYYYMIDLNEGTEKKIHQTKDNSGLYMLDEDPWEAPWVRSETDNDEDAY